MCSDFFNKSSSNNILLDNFHMLIRTILKLKWRWMVTHFLDLAAAFGYVLSFMALIRGWCSYQMTFGLPHYFWSNIQKVINNKLKENNPRLVNQLLCSCLFASHDEWLVKIMLTVGTTWNTSHLQTVELVNYKLYHTQVDSHAIVVPYLLAYYLYIFTKNMQWWKWKEHGQLN